jgi:hypothetical protein
MDRSARQVAHSASHSPTGVPDGQPETLSLRFLIERLRVAGWPHASRLAYWGEPRAPPGQCQDVVVDRPQAPP